jgi:hypothetical protein
VYDATRQATYTRHTLAAQTLENYRMAKTIEVGATRFRTEEAAKVATDNKARFAALMAASDDKAAAFRALFSIKDEPAEG